MSQKITRRRAVKCGLMASALVPALGWMGYAAATAGTAPAGTGLPPLDPTEPAAKTLGFINDAAKVDTTANPRYQSGQLCANCEQFIGKPSDAIGGCVLFPGKSVPAAGWCKVWRKSTKL